MQPHTKKMLHAMYREETHEQAVKAYDRFMAEYRAEFPRAVECLTKDQEALFAFYASPAGHWEHLRTTNPIESTFATVRHRTRQTKGCGLRLATLTMVYQLAWHAETRWWRFIGYDPLGQVVKGVVFMDGVLEQAT